MMKSPVAWIHAAKWSACGARDFSPNAWLAWRRFPDRAAPGLFPPEVVAQIKALACELPSLRQIPLSRWSAPEIGRHAVQSGLVASISDTTIWRWLDGDLGMTPNEFVTACPPAVHDAEGLRTACKLEYTSPTFDTGDLI